MRGNLAEADVFQDAAEGTFEVINGVDVINAAVGNDAAVDEDDFVAVLRHGAEVVRGDEHEVALTAQGFQEFHHRVFGFGVHAGKGFVQEDDAAFLGQRAGEEDALFLPTGECADLPSGKISDTEALQRGSDCGVVLRPRAAQEAHMAVAAQHDHVFDEDGEVPVDILALRNVGDAVLPHRLGDGQAIDLHRAGLRADDAHDGVEQG